MVWFAWVVEKGRLVVEREKIERQMDQRRVEATLMIAGFGSLTRLREWWSRMLTARKRMLKRGRNLVWAEQVRSAGRVVVVGSPALQSSGVLCLIRERVQEYLFVLSDTGEGRRQGPLYLYLHQTQERSHQSDHNFDLAWRD